MNELADFSKEQLMTSREIAVLTGKQHRHVVRDIDNLNESYVKLDMPKVGHIYYSDTMNRQQKAYNLTKIQTFDLMTGYSAELRIKVNRRWEELESKQLDFNDPDTVLRLVQSWKMEKERRIELSEDNKIKEQVIIGKNHQLREQEPLVNFAETVKKSNDTILVRELAKYISNEGRVKVGEKGLFEWLRKENILMTGKPKYNRPAYKDKKHNEPFQKYIEMDIFKSSVVNIQKPDSSFTKTHYRITGKGRVYLLNRYFKAHGISKLGF